jgi:hypothetical protein
MPNTTTKPTFEEFNRWFRSQPIPYQNRRETQASAREVTPLARSTAVYSLGEALRDMETSPR